MTAAETRTALTSLDLFDVDFLTIRTAIRISIDVTQRIPDKRHSSQIVLEEECLFAQRKVLIFLWLVVQSS